MNPSFEGVQHAVGPDSTFHPRPPGAGLSATFSPLGHCLRGVFVLPRRHASSFLAPFAPQPLRRFFATMGPLTPTGIPARQVSVLHVTTPSNRAISKHLGSNPPRSFATEREDPPVATFQSAAQLLSNLGCAPMVGLVLVDRSPPVVPPSRRESGLGFTIGSKLAC